MIRGKEVALSLLVVGTAAAAGYVFRSSARRRRLRGRSKASIGARIVEEVPHEATVVDISNDQLRDLPSARRAIDRAISNDAREEWEHVTLEREGAWMVVDALRRSLPYYENDDRRYNGVYVRYDDRIVVLDAIGWARIEEPVH